MKKRCIPMHLIALLSFMSTVTLSAELIIDGGFNNGFAGTASILSGDAVDIGGDGLLIDDGWIDGVTNGWSISANTASRGPTNANKFSSRGFGQMVSNSAGYANGQDIVLSFDYDLSPGNLGFGYVLYGVTGDSTGQTAWESFNGDGVKISVGEVGPSGGSGTAGSYVLTELSGGPSNVGALNGAGSFSDTITLGDDYDFFIIAFATDVDQSTADSTLNNVSLTGSGGSGVTYYADPVYGSMSNDGSLGSPWGSLEDIFDNNTTFSAGDVIILQDGNHGDPLITGANTGTVSIIAASGASPYAGKIIFQNASNWSLSGLIVSPETANGTYTNGSPLIDIRTTADHILITNCVVYSTFDSSSWSSNDWNTKSSKGIFIQGEDCIVEDNEVFNISNGIIMTYEATRSEVNYNNIYNFKGDGMRVLGNYQKAQYNTIYDCYNSDSLHNDGIQCYSPEWDNWSPGDPPQYTLTGSEIRGNYILNFTRDPSIYSSKEEEMQLGLLGPIQGIVCLRGVFKEWVIENNIIIIDNYNGIVLNGGLDCIIRHNSVIEHPDDLKFYSEDGKDAVPKLLTQDLKINHDNDWQTPHVLAAYAENTLVANNLGAIIKDNSENTQEPTIQVGNLESSDFANLLLDYANFDARLKLNSAALDIGDSQYASLIDWEEESRDDGYPDVGADER